ncbi:MAG: type II secretion system F family protein [Pirellulales bacterium]|nr:type II secretion system F family protein [Pirellulales bacterium]
MNAESNSPLHSKLGAADSTELGAAVAELTKAGLPLPAGLRAMAKELPSWRLRSALYEMAFRLERGESIEAVMASASQSLPPHLYGLLLAGLRSGRLPEVMEEYIQTADSQRKLRQRLRLSLAYPICLAIIMTLMVFAFDRYLIGSFEKIFKDFGTSLPIITLALFAVSKFLPWIMVGLVAIMFLLPLLASDAPGFGWLTPVAYRIPLLGTLLKYTRWAMFSKLTAMLLEQRTPLPEAFRLIAAGLYDPYLRRACRKTAAEVETGCRLSDSMQNQRRFPPSLIPFVRWGEKEAAVPEAFSCANQLYEGRANSQTASFMALLVPIMFLLVFFFAGFVIIAIFMPLISLITSLTGGHK